MLAGPLPEPAAEVSAYFEKGGRQQTPAYQLSDLSPGHTVPGPMLLIDNISCIVVRAPLQQCGFASMRSAAETAWKGEGKDCVVRALCRRDSLASCGVVDPGAAAIGVAHAPHCAYPSSTGTVRNARPRWWRYELSSHHLNIKAFSLRQRPVLVSGRTGGARAAHAMSGRDLRVR